MRIPMVADETFLFSSYLPVVSSRAIAKHAGCMFRGCDSLFVRGKQLSTVYIEVDSICGASNVNKLLQHACLGRNMYIVKKILEQGFEYNIDYYLYYARKGGHHEGQNCDIVNLLIEHGANNCWNGDLMNTCQGGHLCKLPD